MKLRTFLFKVLGPYYYLRLVSFIYIFLVKNGFFKSKYPELFYLKKIIKEGYVSIDIGANVGYYAVILSCLSGKNGKLYAIEPVQLFGKVLKKNLKCFGTKNFKIFPYALGKSEGSVKMGTPTIDGVFRHGLTKVLNENDDCAKTYDVEMKNPLNLFNHLEKLDFIKCDVEGFEIYIIPEFKDLLQKFKPVIQIEITPEENKKNIYEFLNSMGYKCYYLFDGNLLELKYETMLQLNDRDYYFKNDKICLKL